MLKFLKNFNYFFISMVIILVMIVVFSVILPLFNKLSDSAVQNHVQMIETKYLVFKNQLNKFEENSKSVTSRTDVKNGLVTFHNGEFSITQLRYAVFSQFIAGVEVLDHVVDAILFADDYEVTRYRNYSYKDLVYTNNVYLNGNMRADFFHEGDKIMYRVSLPIEYGIEQVGFCVLLFDLSDAYDFLDDKGNKTEILSNEDIVKKIGEKRKVYDKNDVSVYDDNEETCVVISMKNDCYFVVTTDSDLVTSEVVQFVKSTMYTFLTLIIIIMGTMYLFLYVLTLKKAKRIEMSRNQFRDYAYKDKLTVARSRRFLDFWHMNLRQIYDMYAIIVADINGLKKINDKYGHLIGDNVIKKVAEVLNDVIREDDYLVRFGGDEFILLLAHLPENEINNILKRIHNNIDAIDEFNFSVSISCGASTLFYDDNYDEKFNIADKEMYKNKKKHYKKMKEDKRKKMDSTSF